VNRFDRVYIERAGKLELTSFSFKDNQHLMQIIDRIVSRIGRRVDESSPMVDARLADGSRVNAIIPPLALDGPCLSIRRFGRDPVTARKHARQQDHERAHAGIAFRHGQGSLESAYLGRNGSRQDHPT